MTRSQQNRPFLTGNVGAFAIVMSLTAAASADKQKTAKPDKEPPQVVCAAQTGQRQADEDGFVSLFDGKSLKGWEVMNDGRFSAENGVIKLDRGRGWLRSEKKYQDFILKLEVRWLKLRQDSGVFLRASKEGKNWPDRRYEVQCENSERVARIFGAKHERDAELAAKLLKATGEWNSYKIKCVGPKLEVTFNGRVVAASDSLEPRSGYIGLQGEGGLLEFRNLRIKTLKPQ